MSHLHSLLPARSWLFVPGNRPDRFQKALDTDADKVIVDLEDSVPPTERVAARAALARAHAEADPGDLPCFPVAVRNGRRFPWSIALQFAAARDLATLAATHRAARDVCRHEQTAKRVLKARHGRGCKRAKDTKCKCGGCTRVALLLRASKVSNYVRSATGRPG